MLGLTCKLFTLGREIPLLLIVWVLRLAIIHRLLLILILLLLLRKISLLLNTCGVLSVGPTSKWLEGLRYAEANRWVSTSSRVVALEGGALVIEA